MNTRQIIDKFRRLGALAFDNAVRLHEDAILLFDENRIPSALHTEILSVEEIGKSFLNEHYVFHAVDDYEISDEELDWHSQHSFSHRAKQQWFARHAEFDVSRRLMRLLRNGDLERIKQDATYVGFPRKGKRADLTKRVRTPFRTSRRTTEQLITEVNDFLVTLALGTRKGLYILDIPEIHDWISQPQFEAHLRRAWPRMRKSVARRIRAIERLDDQEE
jgi:AbiV family abortive infection protein